MLALPRFFAALLLLSLAGCASLDSGSPASLTFVIVRHAEKAASDPTQAHLRDPGLSEAGLGRAQALAASLANAPMVAVYATRYRRTRQTAEPAAQGHGLPITAYDAALAPSVFARQLRQAHHTGQVLVVGHSNTASELAAALCGCDVAPMGEDEYDRRMTVHIGADDAVTLITVPAP